MKTMTVEAGTTISKACTEAAMDARLEETEISFEFNGITVVAKPTSSGEESMRHAADLVAGWHAELERKVEAHKASPAYAEEQARRVVEVTRLQALHDSLVKSFPEAGHEAWLKWIKSYTEAVGHVDVKHEFWLVAKKLFAAGYRRNDEVGAADLEQDADRMARWIAGQFLDGIEGPGVVHPMVGEFADRWLTSFRSR